MSDEVIVKILDYDRRNRSVKTWRPSPPSHRSAPALIVVFATTPDDVRRHERYRTRKEAANGVRDARGKGCRDINVMHFREEAQNVVLSNAESDK